MKHTITLKVQIKDQTGKTMRSKIRSHSPFSGDVNIHTTEMEIKTTKRDNISARSPKEDYNFSR